MFAHLLFTQKAREKKIQFQGDNFTPTIVLLFALHDSPIIVSLPIYKCDPYKSNTIFFLVWDMLPALHFINLDLNFIRFAFMDFTFNVFR